MNTSLNSLIRIAALVLATSLGSRAMAQADTVTPPAKRQEALDKGRKLMAPREIVPVTVDPFHPEAFAQTVAGMGRVTNPTPSASGADAGRAPVPAGPRSNRDLLQAIATSLKPSGYIVLGGQPSLSFGQKRVKPGGLLTITFEGAEYTVEIKSIDRTNFTLRLNNEEFTRTIK